MNILHSALFLTMHMWNMTLICVHRSNILLQKHNLHALWPLNARCHYDYKRGNFGAQIPHSHFSLIAWTPRWDCVTGWGVWGFVRWWASYPSIGDQRYNWKNGLGDFSSICCSFYYLAVAFPLSLSLSRLSLLLPVSLSSPCICYLYLFLSQGSARETSRPCIPFAQLDRIDLWSF